MSTSVVPASVAAMPFDHSGLTVAQGLNLDRLLLLATAMGVCIEWADLGPSRRGEYHDDAALIRLNVLLRGFQGVKTLSHELAHAIFRDRSSTPFTEDRAHQVGDLLSAVPLLTALGVKPVLYPQPEDRQ